TPSSFTCTLPDTKDTVAAGVVERGGFTTRTNVVILFSGLPLTRIEKVPVGVDSVVLMVSSILQVGWHPFRLNDGVAPAGNPEAESETFSVVPEISVAVIVVEPAPPSERKSVVERASAWPDGGARRE